MCVANLRIGSAPFEWDTDDPERGGASRASPNQSHANAALPDSSQTLETPCPARQAASVGVGLCNEREPLVVGDAEG